MFCDFLEDGQLKKICVSVESLEQSVLDAELISIARMVHCLESQRFPLCIRSTSTTFLRVLSDSRDDERRFIVHERFTSEVFLECFRQAHQNFFGMLEVVTVVDNIVLRMHSALCEAWTEGERLLCRCIRQGTVSFGDLRDVADDLIELWPKVHHLYVILGCHMLKRGLIA